MSVTRAKAWPYAEKLLSRPQRRVPVVIRRGKGGVTLLHRGRALTRCYDTGPGRMAAELVALALGVPVPSLGESISARVSTAALYRAIALSSMDARVPEARPLIERLVEEASQMRYGEEDEDLG
ncbi:MAG: hypothetical protein HY684_03975 [Chloroflexi bacterium]|nr:hypothetical protein [Chloroflexota bacterium]